MSRRATLRSALAGAALALIGLPAGAAPPDSIAAGALADSLAASSAPVWVPDRPVGASEGWEIAARAPLYIITVPLSLLGGITDHGFARFEARRVTAPMPLVDFFLGAPPLGVKGTLGHLGRGVGFSLGLDIDPPARDHLFSGSVGLSTYGYSRTMLALTSHQTRLSYLNEWRPRDQYYGQGMDSFEDSLGYYSWRQQRYQLSWADRPQARKRKEPRGVLVWAGLREGVMGGGSADPSIEVTHPGFAPMLDGRQQHVILGGMLAHDTRAGEPHWTHGHRVELRGERFVAAGDNGIRGSTLDAPSYTRLRLAAESGFSFMRDPRTLRLAVRLVSTGQVGGQGELPVPDLVLLGGHEGLESLPDGRFRDHDLAHGVVRYIIPLSKHLETEVHAEAAAVCRELSGLRWGSLRESYGFTFRLRSDERILASAGLDWSPGAVRAHYDLLGGW